jgi:enoyl-[acyl-carrier protein] reductase III
MEKKAALVTGGTRGIGRAVVLQLAENGYQIILANYLQNDVEAKKTQSILKSKGADCELIRANLANLDEIDDLFKQVEVHCNHIDAFVHCAALNAFKPLIKIKPNQWDLTINVNTRSFLYSVQKCVSLMPEGGSIVAISSLGSTKVIPNYGAMGPAKSALESIVRYLAAELAPVKIRVNAVCGGIIETDSLMQFPDAENYLKEIVERTPAGRIGKPEDIANAVLFLCSSSAEYVYGHVFVVDGGLSLF